MSTTEPVVLTFPQDVQPRLDLLDLTTLPQYAKHKDLFLLALTLLKERPAEDFRSFYQIAGIHGLPFTAYDSVMGSDHQPLGNTNYLSANQWGGYCWHGSQLFPTWHRAYVGLVEQEVIGLAKGIAQMYKEPGVRAQYEAAAEELRFPYWNWLNAESTGVPSILTAPTVSVYPPNFDEASNFTTKSQALIDAIEGWPTIIDNPLHTFTFPKDTMWGGALPPKNGRLPDSYQLNYAPPLDPNELPAGEAPFAPYAYPPALEGDSTLRHPNRAYEANNETLEKSVLFAAVTDLLPTWWRAITDERNKTDYYSFATTAGKGASLESVHNHLHLCVGGNPGSFEAAGADPSGHMALNEVAAFDPIFFLHHCNVDRLLAWYQAVNPDPWLTDREENNVETWVNPQTWTTSGTTPLYPFRKAAAPQEAFWTSDDLRHTKELGYVYPDVQSADPKVFKTLLKRFRPDRYTGPRHYLQLNEIPKWQLSGVSFTIHVYVYAPVGAEGAEPLPSTKVLASPSTAPPDVQAHYAGAASVFTSASGTKCANCNRDGTQFVNDEVDLTRVLILLGLIKESAPDAQLPDDFEKYIHLVAVAINGDVRVWTPGGKHGPRSGSAIKAKLDLDTWKPPSDDVDQQ